jgi:hypothetical protein
MKLWCVRVALPSIRCAADDLQPCGLGGEHVDVALGFGGRASMAVVALRRAGHAGKLVGTIRPFSSNDAGLPASLHSSWPAYGIPHRRMSCAGWRRYGDCARNEAPAARG